MFINLHNTKDLDFGGQIITLFIGDIQRNCEFALIAYEDILEYSRSMKVGDDKTLNRFWLPEKLKAKTC